MGLIHLRSVASAREVCAQVGSWYHPPQSFPAPRSVYQGQSFDPLFGFIQHYGAEIPGFHLKLGVIEDATVIVQRGFDGLILDRSGTAVRETSYYGEIFWKNINYADLNIYGEVSPLEDIFVSFDGSWGVYYHWLLFCLGSAGVANKLLPSATSIAIPDWTSCAPSRTNVISKNVFDEVKRVVDPGRLLSLSDGAYHARRAYFLYIEDGQPSDAALHSLYRDVFRGLRSTAMPSSNSRIFISRAGRGGGARVTVSDEKVFKNVMSEYNIQNVLMEDLSFQSQINLFSKASLIVSPHGSALANLVFAPKTAKVLELQTEIDSPGLLRPWF
jgi:hypothetical protein